MRGYRDAEDEMRAAVSAALALGCSAADVDDYFFKWDGAGAVIPTDLSVDAFIGQLGFWIQRSLRKGGLVGLRGFGTLFVGKRAAFTATGAVAGWIPAAKVPRFEPAQALRDAVARLPVPEG